MTHRLALYLGGFILALILLDLLATGGANLLFLARKFDEFVEWLAFWR